MIWAYHPLPGCMSCGSCQWRTMMGAMTSGPLRPCSLRAVAAQSCLRRSCSRMYTSIRTLVLGIGVTWDCEHMMTLSAHRAGTG